MEEEVNFSYVNTHAYFECSNLARAGAREPESDYEWCSEQVNERVSDVSKIGQ